MSLPPDKIASLFNAGDYAHSPGFPAMRFATQAAFEAFAGQAQSPLAARAAYEETLGARAPSLMQSGTCAPCLRATSFTSATAGGVVLRDGRCLPNWRETMACDCPDPLNNRQRALLHFVQAAGVLPWSRLLLLGAPSSLDAKLAAMVAELVAMRPYHRAAAAAGGFHLAVSQDYLQFVPDLPAALAGVCARLQAGGRFMFTVPFQPRMATSSLLDSNGSAAQIPAEFHGQSHQFGWDLLEMLRQAGFRDASAHFYWSEELGYLGPQNFIFRAVR